MTKRDDLSERLRVASPCPVGWDKMEGDERVRFCGLCSLNVYHISELTGDEVRALVSSTEGRLCVRLYRRADGTVLTRDCPKGLRALRRRAARRAGAALAAALSLCTVALGLRQPRQQDQACTHVAELTLKRAAAQGERAAVTGTVADALGALIPGALVSLKNERTKQKFNARTTEEGEFKFPPLPAGRYTFGVEAPGFKPHKQKHLDLRADEAVQVAAVLKPDGSVENIGVVVDLPMIESGGGRTVIRGKAIQSLPIPR